MEKKKENALKYNLGAHRPEIRNIAQQDMERLSKNYVITVGTTFQVDFPWDRLFEVSIENLKTSRSLRNAASLRLLPDVPVFKE